MAVSMQVVWDRRAQRWVVEKLGVVGYEEEEYEHIDHTGVPH